MEEILFIKFNKKDYESISEIETIARQSEMKYGYGSFK